MTLEDLLYEAYTRQIIRLKLAGQWRRAATLTLKRDLAIYELNKE